jgi:hypothetical protein
LKIEFHDRAIPSDRNEETRRFPERSPHFSMLLRSTTSFLDEAQNGESQGYAATGEQVADLFVKKEN